MRRRPPPAYVIRTVRDLTDAIDAYTRLRISLLQEIATTAATTNDLADPVLREIDRDRLAEARAQLERVDGALGMLQRRLRSTSRRTAT